MTWLDVLRRLLARIKSRIGAYWVDFDQDASDVFFGVNYLMVIGGLQLNSKNPKLRYSWNIYRSVTLLALPLLAWKLALNVIEKKELGAVLQGAQIVLGTVTILFRQVLTARNYDSIMIVRCYVNERCFGRMLESSLSIRALGFYNVRRVVVLFCLFECCALFPLAFTDLAQNDTFGLPFNLRDSWELFQIFSEKTYLVMLTGLTAKYVMNNLTLYMILKGFLTELTVVAETFKGIMDRAEKSTSTKFDNTAGASRHLHRTKQHFFWKYLHEEFRDSIQLHQDVMNTLDIVKPLLNATFLILYYSTTLNIAFGTVYLLSTDPSQLTVYSCQVLYYVGALMSECWILTHLVTSLTEMNETIAEAIYDLPWPQQLQYEPEFANHYRSTWHLMSTVMVRARAELRLNCFGFFEFTLERFAELVNLAYSLVTFFRNFV